MTPLFSAKKAWEVTKKIKEKSAPKSFRDRTGARWVSVKGHYFLIMTTYQCE